MKRGSFNKNLKRRILMKYKVISVEHCTKDKAIEQLTEQVNELLEKGWRPQGGIAIAQIHAEWFLVAQAMLKKE